MKLALCVGILLVAGRCVATKNDAPTPQDAADAVIAAALKRALVEARDLPDFNLIDASDEIIVRSSIMNSPFSVRAAALPKVPGKKVRLLTRHEIDDRAARGDVYFVAVDNLKHVSDDVELTIGTGMGGSRGDSVLCCCVETVRYVRIDGVWTYRGSTGKICR